AVGIGANMYYTTRLLPLVMLLYLGHRLVVERTAFFGRHLRGLLLFALVVLVTAGPLIQFALQNPQEFGSRMDQVSILKEVTSRGNLQPLAENLRKHLLMFNYQGDANGRHNLASTPMLDQVTGALFVLGLLLALRRAYRGPYFFTLAWSAVMLTGGVFSLSFEAPQGLRSIDETVAVALLASLPIVSMWEGLDRVWAGEFRLVPPRGLRNLGLPVAALPVIGILALVGFLNYDRYFVKQASDTKSWSVFSTAETQISREINALGSNYAVYLGPTFTSHPTIEFLTGRRGLPSFDPVAQLPLRDARGVALFLEPNQTEAISTIRRLYPQAEIRRFSPPSGGDPLLYSVVVRQPDVLRLQGMTASYYANSDWSGEPALTEQVPSTSIELGAGLPTMPFSARWESTLASPTYGRYRFKVEGPTSVNVWLDGSPLEHTNDVQEVVMAKGNHSLVISAIVTEATAIRLLWQPPNTAQMVPISQGALFNPAASAHGLLGSYYRNAGWNGTPALEQIDPYIDRQIHLLPLPRPYTVEWKGKIDIPRSGSYRFGTESADTSWMYIDERLVVTNDGANRQFKDGSVTLDEGYHDIRIRFIDQTDHTFVRLSWTPPGGQREVLPSTRLYPPPGQLPSTPARSQPATLAAVHGSIGSPSRPIEGGNSKGRFHAQHWRLAEQAERPEGRRDWTGWKLVRCGYRQQESGDTGHNRQADWTTGGHLRGALRRSGRTGRKVVRPGLPGQGPCSALRSEGQPRGSTWGSGGHVQPSRDRRRWSGLHLRCRHRAGQGSKAIQGWTATSGVSSGGKAGTTGIRGDRG
ncbi:MAG TPA: PA14 domain-containing protein, partial [Chloroflexota bacterium]|nr:PA14 domain-containing protein [Chloroflexota bacterium]